MAWRSHDITKDEASIIVATARHKEELEWSKGFSFSATKINAILDQTDCTGIRIYLGRKRDQATEQYVDTVVVVGVKEETTTDPPSADDMYTGIIAEYGYSTHESPAVRDSSGSPLAKDA